MPDQLPPPLLALDVQAIIGVIVLLISFLGWVFNQLGANKKNPPQAPGRPAAPRPARPARPADERLQNEIEVFLREVTGRPQQAKPERPREAASAAPERPARQKTVVRREVPKPKERPRTIAPQTSRPVESAPQRTTSNRPQVGTPALGQDLQTHVQQYMQENRTGSLEAHHLQTGVAGSVSEHLGAFTAASQSQGTQPTSGIAARQVVALLRNPASVRQAILLNELLSPPKALRK